MKRFNEDTLAEQPAMEWLKNLGYDAAFGPDIAPMGPFQERSDYRGVVLDMRLLRSLRRLNPGAPDEALNEAVIEIKRAAEQPQLIFSNKQIYEFISRGVAVQAKNKRGQKQNFLVKVIDFIEPLNNEFLAVNQFAIQGAEKVRRPDVLVFVNGLPLAIFELKSPTSEQGTIDSAVRQLEKYKSDIPALFAYNQILVVSDLLTAKHGTISSAREWFAEWKYVDQEGDSRPANLETLISGIFHKQRFLDIIQNFIVFEADSDSDAATYAKKMCKYHQYYGVNLAVERTLKAMRPKGGRKIGVFWHTQGSGKTLSMVFYVNKIRNLEELKSPTVLFLTDRNDLDDQINKTFSRSGYAALVKHMETIEELKQKLRAPGAEIIFTTIQKFQTKQEMLSENENIIVIADEAHRGQYKEFAGNIRDALPKASFMGITGTPISFSTRDTRLVFGDVISVYRIDQSVKDEATVPIYYEGRLVPLDLKNLDIDEDYERLLDNELKGEEAEKLKRKLVRLEGAVAVPGRLDTVAQDIVKHFNGRGLEGKGMVVCINRQVAVELYKRIVAISGAPQSAVVISSLQEYAGQVQKELNVKELEKQFKNQSSSLKLAIVCDMWLTGFDVPPLHTMYIDKPLKGHTLMQAIARVNRIYKDKPAGLIVDYIGVAVELKKALSLYSSDIKDKGVFPLEEAIKMMQEKYASVKVFFGNLDWVGWGRLEPVALASLFQAAVAAVLGEREKVDEERKKHFIDEVLRLEKLHALVMPHPEANKIRDGVAFFLAIKQAIYKTIVVASEVSFGENNESAVRKLIGESITVGQVVDLFAAEGKARPEISIFDDKFLQEVKKLRFKNLAVEMLRKLLRDELRLRERDNRFRFVPFRQLLEDLIEKYENNIISSSEVIEKLIELAKQIKLQDDVGLDLGLSKEELAFYDALFGGKKSIKNDEKLKQMVKELVSIIRRDTTIDWTNNEMIKSRIRANVRLLLLRNGFSPEETSTLVDRVFTQARFIFADKVVNELE